MLKSDCMKYDETKRILKTVEDPHGHKIIVEDAYPNATYAMPREQSQEFKFGQKEKQEKLPKDYTAEGVYCHRCKKRYSVKEMKE